MSTTDKDKTLALLKQQVKDRRENKLRYFAPYPKQAEFIRSTATYIECGLQANNQGGKSETAAYTVACWATGIYPDGFEGRRWDRPTKGWAAGESSVAVRDINQTKLCGPSNNPELLGTGFIPKHLIIGTVLGHGAGGGFDKIMVRHVSGGTSEIWFKSYDQDVGKWQGATLDWVWCDEQPPLDHYMEGLARLIATNGLIISTFTPLPNEYEVRNRLIERTSEAFKNRCLTKMDINDCKHLEDPEVRARLIATFGYQARERIWGLPSMGASAVFDGVELSSLIEQVRFDNGGRLFFQNEEIETQGLAFLWALDFGILHPFAAVLLMHERDSDIITVLREIRIVGGIPAAHASAMKAIAPQVRVVYPFDGDHREKGTGETLASLYRKEQLNITGEHATAKDGGYKTEPEIVAMHSRMMKGTFKVAQGCRLWQDEFSTYHRNKDGLIVKQQDDLLSATRVGCMTIRSARSLSGGDPTSAGGRGWTPPGQRGSGASATAFYKGSHMEQYGKLPWGA